MALAPLSAGWLWETDAGHRIAHVFGRACRVDGGRPVLGLRPWEVPGFVAPAEGEHPVRQALRERRAFENLAWLRRNPQGHTFHCIVSGEPVWGPRGRFLGFRGVGRDITASIEAEHALNASESQLVALIDSAIDAILTVDAAGQVLVFNQAASDLFGCSRSAALHRPLEDFIPGGLPAMLSARDTRLPGVWKHVRAGKVQARRAGGGAFVADASLSRVQFGGRELFTVVLRDLTDRLALEKVRDALEAQLRESQKMEALGTLAGGIAHDFNNIVAAILGNVGLAQSRMPQEAPAQVFVQEIGKAGLRARELVERILAFSRKQPATYTCQPLQPVVQEAVQLLRATLPSGIEVVAEFDAEPLHAKVDATQIGQVLMNLGTNAWQALGSQPGRITVRLNAHGLDEACLSVQDNGCGMDEATQARIFEPFFTTKPKGEGTGLGLPVVHGVVTGHGGRIAVTSRKGRGTRFDIHLPLSPECAQAAPPLAPRAAPQPAPGRGEHVLYLDDYPAIVFMVKATLEAKGYRVTGFEDAGEALAWMAEHGGEVDLLVTDFNMPHRSGLDVAREALALRPGLPVIVASGYVTDELREGAQGIGVARLFDKPRGIEGLCEMIGELLRPAVEMQ